MASRYRFKVEEFERLFLGVPHVELLHGEVYQMSPIGPRHVYAVAALNRRLQGLEDAVVLVQSPLRLSEDSEPEPDLLLVKPPMALYKDRLPEAKDVLLLVEVSDTSLEHDPKVKLPLYAASGIPEVWVLDLTKDRLLIHRVPQKGVYTEARTLFPGQEAEVLGRRVVWWE